MGFKGKSTKTDQNKAINYLKRIKEGKGEVHWNSDELGYTYDFEFSTGTWLCVKRFHYPHKNAKTICYSLTTTTWDKHYNENYKFLKTTDGIGKKIFDELKTQWDKSGKKRM